jgi:hypothetical protein
MYLFAPVTIERNKVLGVFDWLAPSGKSHVAKLFRFKIAVRKHWPEFVAVYAGLETTTTR